MDYDSEEKRRERQHRRKVISDWKAAAITIQDSDPTKRMLMREAKAESLARIEDAARTESDFENVNRIWDDMEIVERWRLAKREELGLSNMQDYELPERDTVIPPPLDHVWWRQLLGGNFIDVIFDCPHEIHELTASRPVYDFTKGLGEDHKEILYFRVIRQWTPQQIAAFRNQTDRNIRKVYNNMMDDICKKMYMRLYPRYAAGESLTLTQREFCETYLKQLDEVQKGKITRKIEEDRRSRKSGERAKL